MYSDRPPPPASSFVSLSSSSDFSECETSSSSRHTHTRESLSLSSFRLSRDGVARMWWCPCVACRSCAAQCSCCSVEGSGSRSWIAACKAFFNFFPPAGLEQGRGIFAYMDKRTNFFNVSQSNRSLLPNLPAVLLLLRNRSN